MEKVNLIDFIKNASLEIDIFKEKDNRINHEKEDKIISELVMHKILYFIYGGFYKNFKKELWNAKFEAWPYGPVEVQYRAYKYDDNPDYKEFLFDESDYNKEEIKYLKKLIIGLIKMGTYNVVEFSHRTDPWINNFNKEKKSNQITNNEIKDFFESEIII